jgi:hypothetical protein
MEWLSGFALPVPRAFASAVSACRFEAGDVFYDSPDAYTVWKPGEGGCWIQVLDPPRSARSAPVDAEGNRFAANWASPVTLERGQRGGGPGPRTLRCTQGRLFTCLWRGDLELLRDSSPEDAVADELPLPGGGRDLLKQLEAATPAVLAALGPKASKGTVFVTTVDESSESSLAKMRAIETALATRYAPKTIDLAPAEAGLPGGCDFHPALRVRASYVDEKLPDRVRELLKPALYAPTASPGEEGRPDRFKLERHGLLVPPEVVKP